MATRPCFATPITIVSTPARILIGSNQVDSGGNIICKLISNHDVVVLKAQNLSRVLDGQRNLVFDSNSDLWTAINGDPEINATQSRVVRSLETSAARLIFLHEQRGLQSGLSRNEFLTALGAHIALATVDHGKKTLSLFVVTFTGWPVPTARIVNLAMPDQKTSFALSWLGDEVPSPLELRSGLDEVTIRTTMKSELQRIAKIDDPNKLAFQPPFEIVAIDDQGVARVDGNPAPCACARNEAAKLAE